MTCYNRTTCEQANYPINKIISGNDKFFQKIKPGNVVESVWVRQGDAPLGQVAMGTFWEGHIWTHSTYRYTSEVWRTYRSCQGHVIRQHLGLTAFCTGIGTHVQQSLDDTFIWNCGEEDIDWGIFPDCPKQILDPFITSSSRTILGRSPVYPADVPCPVSFHWWKETRQGQTSTEPSQTLAGFVRQPVLPRATARAQIHPPEWSL